MLGLKAHWGRAAGRAGGLHDSSQLKFCLHNSSSSKPLNYFDLDLLHVCNKIVCFVSNYRAQHSLSADARPRVCAQLLGLGGSRFLNAKAVQLPYRDTVLTQRAHER